MFRSTNEVYEDAYFLHAQGVGIADGVSSWSTFSIRTDLFSAALMDNAKEALEKRLQSAHTNVNPQNGEGADEPRPAKIDPGRIMDEAFAGTAHCGSSTCCIGVVNGTRLDISNLGDSGFIAFEYKYDRGNYKVFLKEKSKPQQHSFNYPLQLVRLPGPEVHQSLISNGNESLSKELARLVESDAII